MRTACPRHGIRLPVVALAAGVFGVCAGVLALPAAAAQVGPDSTVAARGARGRLSGTVVDLPTRHPVAGARVVLTPLDSGRPLALAEVDSAGAFAFPSVAPGAYALAVRGFGYRELADTVLVWPDGDTFLTASLVPDALDLEPVLVTVERSSSWAMREFERRRTQGIGSFVTRADIEKQHPLLVSDLFRRVAGVRVIRDSRGDAMLELRGRCRPSVYIDGAAAVGESSLDLALRPDDVEGIEVHSTASVPVQYARNACGVVLVWTRVPGRTSGSGSWWKGLAVAGGILGVILVTR